MKKFIQDMKEHWPVIVLALIFGIAYILILH